MKIPKFQPNHKAKLKFFSTEMHRVRIKRSTSKVLLIDHDPMPHSIEKLEKAFESMISWCINGKLASLKRSIANKQKPEFKFMMMFQYDCIDEKTSLNIFEFTAISSQVHIMEWLLKTRTTKDYYFRIGKALDYAIAKDDVEMTECMIEFSLKNQIKYGKIEHLHQAIRLDSFKTAERLVRFIQRDEDEVNDYLFNINDKFPKDHPVSRSALHLASELGRLKFVKLLVENGARINLQEGDIESCKLTFKNTNRTALHLAILNEHYEIMKYLLDNGADVFQLDSKGRSPIMLASNGLHEIYKDIHARMCKLLKSAALKQIDKIGLDHEAAYYQPTNDKEMSSEIIQSSFRTLVSLCIKGDMMKLKEYFAPTEKDAGTLVKQTLPKMFLEQNVEDKITGFSALDFAIVKGHSEVVKFLLKEGAKIGFESEETLDKAIHANNQEILKSIFEHGMEAKSRIHLATKKGLMNIAETFAEDANLDKIFDDGFNSLHQACIHSRLDFVQLLVRKGADLNKKSGRLGLERSALHFAAENNDFKMVEYLIQHGANPNQKDIAGLNPLHVLLKGIKINYDTGNASANDQEMPLPNNDDDVIAKRQIDKQNIMKLLTSKMDKKPMTKQTLESNPTNTEKYVKKRKLEDYQNSEDFDEMAIPFLGTFLNKNLPFEGKLGCLQALESLIAKGLDISKTMVKKEIIEEISIVVEKVIDNDQKQFLSAIAKILCKVNETHEGAKLIKGIRLPFGTYQILVNEMKNFESPKELLKKIKTKLIEID